MAIVPKIRVKVVPSPRAANKVNHVLVAKKLTAIVKVFSKLAVNAQIVPGFIVDRLLDSS